MNSHAVKIGTSSLLVALVALAWGWSTAGADNTRTVVSTSPVSWTVPLGQCADFPTEVTGTGTLKSITSVSTKDGITTIAATSHASGTAIDGDGNKYVWSYSNHFSTSNSLAAPSVYVGPIVDSFTLAGPGPARTRVGFRAEDTDYYDPITGDFLYSTFVPYHVNGDPIAFNPYAPHCDPI